VTWPFRLSVPADSQTDNNAVVDRWQRGEVRLIVKPNGYGSFIYFRHEAEVGHRLVVRHIHYVKTQFLAVESLLHASSVQRNWARSMRRQPRLPGVPAAQSVAAGRITRGQNFIFGTCCKATR